MTRNEARTPPDELFPFSPHVVRALDDQANNFYCPRCHRSLPESNFQPLFNQSSCNVMYLHPLCKKCLKQRSSALTEHPMYRVALHSAAAKLITGIQARQRKRRNLVCTLTADDIIALFIVQNGRCALSGDAMAYDRDAPMETQMSVDRIDSGLNYTLDNVQLVTGRVNLMKGDLSQSHFIKICLKIAEHVMSTVTASGER